VGRAVHHAHSRDKDPSVIFTETGIEGALLIKPEPIEDERGSFARMFCKNLFLDHGLNATWVQCNSSVNKRKGTIRGMHFQIAPGAEIKTVNCVRGAIYDVIVDLRESSRSRGRWYGCTLTAENQHILYVPEGFAHGFQTLEDDTSVYYQMSQFHVPECARGVRWDDPARKIEWPLPVSSISAKDSAFPPFVP
jgi:dTDP-4-dehydrorhamnose 3,5-epimerase